MRAVSGAGLAMGALASVVVVVASGRFGGTVVDEPAADDLAAERQAMDDYDDALRPLLTHGGQVVVEGLQPGIADVAQGAFDDEVLVRMATGWVASLTDITDEVADLSAPPALGEVAVRYERALRTYVRAAEALLAAARATGDERADHVERAADLGRAADRLFDDATAAYDHQRSRVSDPEYGRGTP